jgi:hypothetical protein
MLYRVQGNLRETGAFVSCARLTTSLVVFATAASFASPTHAQVCAAAHQTELGCSTDLRHARLGEMVTSDPTQDRLDSRLDGKPWIGQEWSASPFAVTPTDDTVSMRTSLVQWGEHTQWSTAKRIDELKAANTANITMPKVVKPRDPALDVWSTVNVQGLDQDANRAKRGGVGADYKLDRGTVVGATMERRESEMLAAGLGTQAAVDDYTLAAYFATRANSAVTFDARAQRGETNANLVGHAFATTQSAVAGRVRGNWSFENVRIAPSVSVAHGTDTPDSTRVSADAIEKNTVTLEPRVSHPIRLGGGQVLEPFVSFKRQIEIAPAISNRTAAGETRDAAGVGLTLSRPGGYSLSFSGDVDGIGGSSTAPPTQKGQLRFKVPLQ